MFQVNGKYILKSGTDFRQFSKVTLDFQHHPVKVDITAVDVTRECDPDPELESVLSQYSGVVDAKMSEELGELSCTLDGRFSSVRTQETNLGNLVTDIMVAALNADCALLNSGTLRSDTEHPEGKFYLRVCIFHWNKFYTFLMSMKAMYLTLILTKLQLSKSKCHHL